MPLYVCNDPGLGSAVEMDLFTLVSQDSRFGDSSAPTSNDCQSAIGRIEYPATLGNPGQKLISDLVNNTPSTSIIIYGVDATWPLPGGKFVYQVAGQTLRPSVPGGPIKIVYDVTNAYGAGYYVYDTGGNYIAYPTFIILAHELFHALHIATLTEALDPEAQAIQDENTIRTQFNCAQRDPKRHDGCCNGGVHDPQTGLFIKFQPTCMPPAGVGPCPGTGAGSQGPPCLIVTAAVGSPMAVEVARFQYIRDRLLRSTTIGRLFLDRLAQQYYRFSPRVAEDIAEDPDLRSALNRLLVVPLLDWFALLETHSRGRTLDLEPLVDGTLNRTQDASGSSWDPQAVKVALLSLKKHLDEKRDDVPTAIAGAPIRDVNATCQYLARQIQAHGGAGTELTWAIVDPLLIYWSARASLQIRSITCVSRRLVSALDRWLGAIPIPHSFCTLPQIVVAQDLDHLSRTIWSPYRVKARIGSQLLRRFAPVVPYDLRKLLRGLGYLRTDRISLGT